MSEGTPPVQKRRVAVEKNASGLSVVGCYAFRQNPKRFDAGESVSKSRLNTEEKPADQEALSDRLEINSK